MSGRPGPELSHSPVASLWVPHLRSHAADGGQVIASADEVGGVELQLERGEPLAHGLGALEDTRQPLQARPPAVHPGHWAGSSSARPLAVQSAVRCSPL